MLRCTLPTYRAAPSPISANGPQTAGGVAGRRRVAEIAERRLTQGLGAAELWIGFETIEGRDSEPGCGRRIDRPVRDQQRPGARVEKRPREARQCLRTRLVAGDGVAGRQHHPIGIEPQRRDFAGGEQTVVELGRRYPFARASPASLTSIFLNSPGPVTRSGKSSRSVVEPACMSMPSGSQPVQHQSAGSAPSSLVA